MISQGFYFGLLKMLTKTKTSIAITHPVLAFLLNIDNREGERWASHTCECHCRSRAGLSWTWSFNADHLTLVSLYPPSVI